ncbi:DDE domain-containing protein [Rhodococcus sp. WS4]|nr:DDE domain-containing protein [Rhodococcus sp. WS4]
MKRFKSMRHAQRFLSAFSSISPHFRPHKDWASQLRHRRARPGDKWHLDEVFMRIDGEQRYVWRAVYQHGNVLDVLVQRQGWMVTARRTRRSTTGRPGRRRARWWNDTWSLAALINCGE